MSDRTTPPAPADDRRDAGADPGDEHLATLHRFFDLVLVRGDAAAAARLVAHDFVEHAPPAGRGRAEFLADLMDRRAACADADWTLEYVAVAGDTVACHLRATTRASGGAARRLAPRCRVRSHETLFVRFREGRLAECWRTCSAVAGGAARAAGP